MPSPSWKRTKPATLIGAPASFAAASITFDTRLSLQPRDPAQHQILADAAEQLGQLGRDRAAGAAVGGVLHAFERAVARQRQLSDSPHERLEQLVAGDEIGLRIDLDDGAGAAP